MARLPYLDVDDLAPEDQRLLDPPLNLFRVLAYCPEGARAFGRLGLWIRFKTKLDPRLRQMAILRVGAVTRTDYEYSHHIELGRQFGLSDDDIRAVVAGPDDESLTEVERLVVTAADEMTTGLGIGAGTFKALRGHLDEGMMVELTMTLSYYNGVVRMLNSLDIDVEPAYERYLEEFPLDR
ncbi:MAG: carboxymuconolactone decarboxylase family protein [Holophagales bacterium]|nr:carboxymuconolactone decarboxylase family protein [Holophagales bacterium]MYD23915.1 carboxymuconolactone decarboxylase family protein [Holophagales bacterium]MYI34564.1 carboxymuconolactone decarboxylase family protein [Holophagales bacterium]